MTNQVIHGDCMDVMREMEDNSIDTILTDPPYHLGSISKRFAKTSLGDDNDTAASARNGSNQYARLSTGFMGARWDGGGIAFQPELWAEMLRVAKPGATLLAFGGTRTHHRLMVAIEDAGWEIRDCLMWLYGSGFPKSHNISKAIDKAAIIDCANCDGKGYVMPELSPYDDLVAEDPDNHITYEDWLYFQTPEGIIARQYKCANCNGTGKIKGKEREVVGIAGHIHDKGENTSYPKRPTEISVEESGRVAKQNRLVQITAPATEAAATWEGWGSGGLKPAYEPIIYAQKPIDGTYANNAQVHGVAGLNIDGARIGVSPPPSVPQPQFNSPTGQTYNMKTGEGRNGKMSQDVQGRWPANVLLSHAEGAEGAEGCVRRGEKRVKSGSIQDVSKYTSDSTPNGVYGKFNNRSGIHHADPNGLETVADWDCVDGCPIRILDEQAGVRKSAKGHRDPNGSMGYHGGAKGTKYKLDGYNDSGSASRFFYTAKAPPREKWFFCQLCAQAYPNKERDDHAHDIDQGQRKHIVAHPTVKPQSIVNYLCKLTKTPTGGVVLDPFAGSGTTGLACLETGRDFILIEKEADYYEIAKARVEAAMSQPRQAELW